MGAAPELHVLEDAAGVARDAAARLVAVLADVELALGADIVLTGGGTGTALLRAVLDVPGHTDVPWGAVHVWWGDDRWVPADDSERNEKQAREALLNHLPLDPAKVHAMGAQRDGASMDADARTYADALAVRARERGDVGSVPAFDVLLLGLGPEGHVGSVFPHETGIGDDADTVVSVIDCPKPPPNRLTLSLPAMRHARETWIVCAGAEKADAVQRLLSGAAEEDLPAAGAQGTLHTLVLADRAAAGR